MKISVKLRHFQAFLLSVHTLVYNKKYDYKFRSQKKAQQKVPDLKEVDKKLADIKKRLMLRDKR